MTTKENTRATRWVFTWNADKEGNLPELEALKEKLSDIAKEGVFQLEKGDENKKLHYQGRFEVRGTRRPIKSIKNAISEMFKMYT